MIIVRGDVRLAAGEIERLRPVLDRTIAATRGEPGCAACSAAVDLDDPNLLRIGEEWSDARAVDAHMQSTHMIDFLEALRAAKTEAIRVDAYEGHYLRTLVGEAAPAGD
jgi:quinol monooxygenase YgiN